MPKKYKKQTKQKIIKEETKDFKPKENKKQYFYNPKIHNKFLNENISTIPVHFINFTYFDNKMIEISFLSVETIYNCEISKRE